MAVIFDDWWVVGLRVYIPWLVSDSAYGKANIVRSSIIKTYGTGNNDLIIMTDFVNVPTGV